MENLIGIQALQKRLNKRKENGLFRKLPPPNRLIDFCSNDYLGFSRSKELKRLLMIRYSTDTTEALGATGSRLLSGNTDVAEKLEQDIAAFHDVEAALLFPSGYQANLGLFSSLLQRGDTLIMDEYVHSSIIDGSRLSFSKRLKFNHNDLDHLEKKLKSVPGTCYVAIESLYSMDGDFAPLFPILELCNRYGAMLIVDEAHAFGVFGKGLVHQAKLGQSVFATVITFGKALGAHGAAILGGHLLRSYLINFSRAFIYSTAMPLSQLLHIGTAYQYLQDHPEKQEQLQNNIRFFQQKVFSLGGRKTQVSPIQALIIPGNQAVIEASQTLRKIGYNVYPILSPTVPKGQERLRICLHSYNTRLEIQGFCYHFRQEIGRL